MNVIEFEKVNELLNYNPENGKLQWKKFRAANAQVGDIAGFVGRDGYVRVKILGRSILAHRIAWLLFYKKQPENEIDHINGDRSDNKISNLRSCDRRQNSRNTATRSDNECGIKGVGYHKPSGKWRARIYVDGKSKFIGNFLSKHEAKKAYEAAAKSIYGDFFRRNNGEA